MYGGEVYGGPGGAEIARMGVAEITVRAFS